MSLPDGTRQPSRKALLIRSTIWLLLFFSGAALWIIYLLTEETGRALRILLVNFLYFTSLSAGLTAWSAMLTLTNAGWAGRLEIIPMRGIAFAIPALVILGALWIGSASFLPWNMTSADPEGTWLNISFLFGRDMALLLAYWLLSWWYMRHRSAAGKGYVQAVTVVIMYVIVLSMLGFDLVMSLSPPWYTTVFGMYFLTSGLYIAIAAWTFIAALGGKASKNQLHDLGSLLVALSLLSIYFMYSQILTEWYENLPEETVFMVQRGFTSWAAIGWILLGVVYLGPMVMLLTAWSKRNRWYLGTVSGIVLVGLWVERYWLVLPSLGKKPYIGLIEFAATWGFIGLTGIVFELFNLLSFEKILQSERATDE